MRASGAMVVMLEIFCRITKRRFAPRAGIHIAFVAAMGLRHFGNTGPALDGNLMISFTSERRALLAAIALVVACCLPAVAQERRQYIPTGAVHAVAAQHGMVVAQEKIGARVGADILRQGGNAVDAAVATGFALAVTYPRAGNIGGGGFMIIHAAERREDVAIDYRETAPAAT